MANLDKKELWLELASAALDKYEPADDVTDIDSLVDDMIDVSTKYADSMLDEFEERFGGGSGGGDRRRKRKRRTNDEP
jgi:hypothetical protein